MKHTFAALALVLAPVVAVAQSVSAEDAAVRTTLTYYMRGHATGNPDTMARAFYTDAELRFIRNGQYFRRSLAEYLASFSGKPAGDESKRQRRITFVDVVGTAAFAKIELDYPSALLTDYMQLLKINGEWKIVHKTFHSEPK